MIPTNQIQISPNTPQSQSDHLPLINEGQTVQFPKIDHILAHASNPELSYIYARPELQATASTPDTTSVTKTEKPTPKKGRPREKKNFDILGEKKPGPKPKKVDVYDKYYIDTTRVKKNPPPKKVDIWSSESWDEIMKRKRKYFEFCRLTGEMTDIKSEDIEEQFLRSHHSQHSQEIEPKEEDMEEIQQEKSEGMEVIEHESEHEYDEHEEEEHENEQNEGEQEHSENLRENEDSEEVENKQNILNEEENLAYKNPPRDFDVFFPVSGSMELEETESKNDDE